MRKISKKTLTLLTAKSGDIFIVKYKSDVPKSTCARHGVKIKRSDIKSLNMSIVEVL
jgi:hypothetical protein